MTSWWPPPSKPLPVEGGLRARSTRGAIGRTWWSERFIDVLESIGIGGRLQRGRTYARQGQVIDLSIDVGAVTALVQGSRARPYRLRVGLAAFGKAQWAQVTRALADNVWYAAKLLAGEMPEDIEDVFAAVDLALFPTGADELSMDCTCPDWEVPCKHIAAVFYLLAESFDDDPFGILAWRGRDRDALLAALSALRSGRPAADRAERDDIAVPLTSCLDTYFAPPADAEIPGHSAPPNPTGTLLDQVPAVDLTVRGVHLADVLRPAYLVLEGDQDRSDADT